MKKTIIKLPEFKLIGITCRTNNLSEMDLSMGKIASVVSRYFREDLAKSIKHRKTPGVTYCVYTNYESDFTGNYTYFIGEEVTSFEDFTEKFETLVIPAQCYAKFTTESGKMPQVCIQAWQQIWAMSSNDLSGERTYSADFEVYHERASNPQSVILDIYIGVKVYKNT